MPACGKRRTTSSEIPASSGVHGPGETTTRSGRGGEQLIDARAVVANYLDLGAELAEVLDEVVGEGVVVVDHERSHATSLTKTARASHLIAPIMAPASGVPAMILLAQATMC